MTVPAHIKKPATYPAKTVSRDAVSDVARGLSILLILFVHSIIVIYIHPFQTRAVDINAFEVAKVISTFVMPSFYFISGMSALGLASRSFRKITVSVLRVVIFVYITHLISMPLIPLLNPGMEISDIATKAIKPFVTGKDFIMVVTWFLISLAGVQFFAWVYLRYNNWAKLSVILITVAAFLLFDLIGKTYFMSHTWALGLLFYLAGREFASRLSGKAPLKIALIIATISIIIFMLIYNINKGCTFSATLACEVPNRFPGFYIDVVKGQFGFIPYFIITAAVGITCLIALSICLVKSPLFRPIAKVGKNSLPLFIISGVFLIITAQLISQFLPTGPYTWFILSIAFTAAQVALYPLLARPINNLLLQCSRWSDYIVEQALYRPKILRAWWKFAFDKS